MAEDKKPGSVDNTSGKTGAETAAKDSKAAAKAAAKAAEKAKKERIKASKPAKKGNIFVRMGHAIAKYWKDFRGTCKKINWPDGKTVVKNSLIVLACIVVIGAGVWITDFILSKGVTLSSKVIDDLKESDTEEVTVTTTAAYDYDQTEQSNEVELSSLLAATEPVTESSSETVAAQ